MDRSWHHAFSLVLASAMLAGGGCATSPKHTDPKPTGSVHPKAKVRVTARPANTRGCVFIVEYHKVAKEEARWDRSQNRFRRDLERLARLGFRPVTLASYLDGTMDLAPGASPIVFTFDDSHPSQFRLLDDGSVDPDCAVGIWRDFAASNPDFPVRATFFVLPDVMWGQRDRLPAKLTLLKEWGCELGVHTWTHRSLKKLTDLQVMDELGRSIEAIESWGFEPRAIALPFGIAPKNMSLLKGFERSGKRYELDAALRVGAEPARSPIDPKRDPFRLPRIQGIEGPYGISYWLDLVEKAKIQPFVAP